MARSQLKNMTELEERFLNSCGVNGSVPNIVV